jgi:hypothetical protein
MWELWQEMNKDKKYAKIKAQVITGSVAYMSDRE